MKKSKILFLILDLLFITSAFIFFIWLKPASRRIYLPAYYRPFLGFAFIWIVTSLIGDKFNLADKKRLKDLLNPIFRIDITILAIAVTLIYIFQRFSYSRMIVFGTILFSISLEIIFVISYYLHRKVRNGFDNPITLSVKPKFVGPIVLDFEDEKFDYKLPEIKNIDETIYPNLKNKYLIDNIEMFDFIEQNINLDRIKKSESFIIHTHTLFNIENVEPASHQLFINLHRINDIRRINMYLIQINKNLKYKGYFIGNCETIQERHKKYFNSFPFFIAAPLYLLDFTYKRIFPKIPILKETYFAISKGENRAISQAEILGRLYFCGFRVIATTEINNLFHFIAVKVREPKEDPNPSYGPFIKLRRVGQDGELFYVYKLRTMHPYSEYLQSYIHNKYQLEDYGKFKEDFRITSWGKIIRRFWIDELPQFINFLKGDLSLVGVRALSEHFFNLYPEDVKKLRTEFKPGIFPPGVAEEIPKSFEGTIQAERKYLLKKLKHPIRTDFKYFFIILYKIIFKNIRGG
ncbi:MAG: sugar transferase [Candidatus Cloacimonetes bacterium]|nr:sugar transferase [Candidatus Cloacimonadota bacterium]